MLYQAAHDALTHLVKDSGITTGNACLVFDVARHAVTHASFANEPGLQLGRAEYLVHVEVPESKSVELSVRAAGINAVNDLTRLTELSADERGLPDMKGLMFRNIDGLMRLAPYSEAFLGFVHKGHVIINPMLSPDRSFEVDPVKAYGFHELESTSTGTGRRLELDHEGGGRLRLTIANNGFIIDRIDDSNLRIAYVFSSELPDAELDVSPAQSWDQSDGPGH